MLAGQASALVTELVAHMWVKELVLEAAEAGVHTPMLTFEQVLEEVYDAAYWVDCGRHSHVR